jgi:glycosyltransferase involved in cell wall biosynthesis
MTITVMICTWNRSHYLNQALGGMRTLQIPSGLDWEVLIINNNSTDNTDEIIARHQNALPIRRLFEPKPGKSSAANTGIRHAKGDLIVCTDDDVLVSPDWITEYVAAERQWPDAAYFGGTILPWFEVEPPRWIKEYLTLRGPYSVLQHGPEVRPFLPSEAGPFGANMAIRAAVLREFSFDPRLGPKEDQILPADDGEFIARLKNAGHRGVWVGPATVRHHIAKELLTSRYIWQWYREHGRSLVLREGQTDVKRVAGVPLWALREHCTSRLSSWLLAPFKGERWVRAYTEAARTRGVIQETRALQNNPGPGANASLFKSTNVGRDQR